MEFFLGAYLDLIRELLSNPFNLEELTVLLTENLEELVDGTLLGLLLVFKLVVLPFGLQGVV